MNESTVNPTIPASDILNYNESYFDLKPSGVKIKREQEGILSYDLQLGENLDQLWLYFLTYLREKSQIGIDIHGYHTESDIGITQQQDLDNQWYGCTGQNFDEVDDFKFSIDLTPYISPYWSRITAISMNKSSIRTILEQYTRVNKHGKEMTCEKQVIGWDIRELSTKIQKLIYSSGYKGTIRIKSSLSSHRITACSPSLASSTFILIFCFISCLFILSLSIYFCFRLSTKSSHRILADYQISQSLDQFLLANQHLIIQAVKRKSFEKYTGRPRSDTTFLTFS